MFKYRFSYPAKVFLLLASFNVFFFIYKFFNLLPVDDILTTISNLEGFYIEGESYLSIYSISSPLEFIKLNGLHAVLLSILNKFLNSADSAVLVFSEFSALAFCMALILYSKNFLLPLFLSFIPLVISSVFSQSRGCLAISLCFIAFYQIKLFFSFSMTGQKNFLFNYYFFLPMFFLFLISIFLHPISFFFIFMFILPYIFSDLFPIVFRLKLSYFSLFLVISSFLSLGYFFNYILFSFYRFTLFDTNQSSLFIYVTGFSLFVSSFGLSRSFLMDPLCKYYVLTFRYIIFVSLLFCIFAPSFNRAFFLLLPLYVFVASRNSRFMAYFPILCFSFLSIRFILASSF